MTHAETMAELARLRLENAELERKARESEARAGRKASGEARRLALAWNAGTLPVVQHRATAADARPVIRRKAA